MFLKRLLSTVATEPKAPPGWRAYAIGDVHGRADLLDQLLDLIRDDHRSRGDAKGLLLQVGDLIDRGPDSRGVIERFRSLDLPHFRAVCLAGNHEEVLLRLLEGDSGQIRGWLRFGGAETLQSYGLDPAEIAIMAPEQAQRQIAAAIPREHQAFLRNLADSFRFGDYLFVHAGIRPGLPVEEQQLGDLRWIREPFLSDRRDHGVTVVHGHTISERVERVGHRIGIDTGAYATGRLTALAIEGDRRWRIDTLDGCAELETGHA